jgi:glycosyltransferase involved in cell wall biosynthesis
VCPEEVLAPCVEPVFSTFVNPSPEKGLGLFLSILEMAAAKRPEIPFLVVESRGSGQLLWDAGRGLGIQLKKANLHIVRNTPRPREIYSVTRVLLVPSMAADAGPRVIPEAQLNGIPVIASDCCGLARVAGFGGFVQPIEVEPGDIHRSAAAEAWFGLICRLYDDSAWYGAASRRAREAVDHYRTGETDRAYLEFFQRVLGG